MAMPSSARNEAMNTPCLESERSANWFRSTSPARRIKRSAENRFTSAPGVMSAAPNQGESSWGTGMQRPDFRTISEFRKRHLAALSGLFRQVLALCREAGLVKLGHVALDGTKIKANAGINKAISYGPMKEGEPKLSAGDPALAGQ